MPGREDLRVALLCELHDEDVTERLATGRHERAGAKVYGALEETGQHQGIRSERCTARDAVPVEAAAPHMRPRARQPCREDPLHAAPTEVRGPAAPERQVIGGV